MIRRRLLGITTSPLPIDGQITDGPGYRMWNLLQVLGAIHEVRVLSLYESFHLAQTGFELVTSGAITVERSHHAPRNVRRRIREIDPDILYLPWSSTLFLGDSNRNIPTVIDYVGPGLFENFASHGRVPDSLRQLQIESFWVGDFFLTTGERERYYLLGLLAASGRLSVGDFPRDDPLVHLVRMTPPQEPPKAENVRRDRDGEHLKILLPGAFLPWYDYSLVGDTIESLPPRTRGRIHIVVLGGNPRMPEMEARVRETLSRGVATGTVEFTGIVPFSRRAEYYLGADVALSVGAETVEDELSSRTRIVDCLWARLPVITTGRDEYSSLLLAAGAAFRYDPNPGSLASVLERIEGDRAMVSVARSRMAQVLEGPFHPERNVDVLMDFLETPRVTLRRRGLWSSIASYTMWARDAAQVLRRGRL